MMNYISIFEIWTSKVGKDSRMHGWVDGWRVIWKDS